MARPRDPHPLGKCAEERLDITMPAEMKERLAAIAKFKGKTATSWARDTLEKAIEGEWVFMQRRVGESEPKNNGKTNP